jgi:Cu2+-exporting ATPase
MARDLDLPENHALGDLTPSEKADLVRQRWSGNSLMIGDGANDSHAFDAALCRGTPSVGSGLLEHKSDFYILGASLAGLATLFHAAKKHLTATRAVFAFAITYNACAVAASLAGLMSPLVAAVIMPLSSLASIAIVLSIFRIPKNQPTIQP